MDRIYLGGVTIPLREITMIEWRHKEDSIRVWTRGCGIQDTATKISYADIGKGEFTMASLRKHFGDEMALLDESGAFGNDA